MSTEEERREIGRQLEQRGLVPTRAEQAAIRREAEQVARRVDAPPAAHDGRTKQ